MKLVFFLIISSCLILAYFHRANFLGVALEKRPLKTIRTLYILMSLLCMVGFYTGWGMYQYVSEDPILAGYIFFSLLLGISGVWQFIDGVTASDKKINNNMDKLTRGLNPKNANKKVQDWVD